CEGGSLFLLRLAEGEEAVSPEVFVGVSDAPEPTPVPIVMHREEVFADAPFHRTASAVRLSRDLAALLRASAAINAIRGLVALERPLIELIADAVPPSRGALVVVGDRPGEFASGIGWRRDAAAGAPVQVSRVGLDRVLRDLVGTISCVPGDGETAATGAERSVLAAPLVAFNKLIGAILLEADGPDCRFDEGHLRLVMAIAGIAATAFEHARQVEPVED